MPAGGLPEMAPSRRQERPLQGSPLKLAAQRSAKVEGPGQVTNMTSSSSGRISTEGQAL